MSRARVDRVLGLLGLARRAGKLEIGEEASRVASRTGRIRVLFLAADASGNAQRRAEGFTARGRSPVVLPYTKEELSAALGKHGCSMLAVTDVGFAYELVSALSRSDGGLGEMASELERLRDRAQKRRRKTGTQKVRQIGVKGRNKHE